MQLRYNPTSPYVRKCTVLIEEVGLGDQIDRVMTHPWTEKTDAHTVNPLGKVPSLCLDDGSVLYDSSVICEYLDTLHDRPKIFPPSGNDRWVALRHQSLGDGIIEAAGDALREKRRVPEEQSPGWYARRLGVVDRGLDHLETEAASFDSIDIGLITVGCALGLMDFRFPDHEWRPTRPKLASWYSELSQRSSFASTEPWEWIPEDGGRMNTWTGWPRESAL